MSTVTMWKRKVVQTSTFQFILYIILFHSLTSIFLIYIHLSWFLSDNEQMSFRNLQSRVDKYSGKLLTWNKQSLLNVLSNDVIPNSEISIRGWWMDHSRWETDIRCFSHKFTLCSKGFSTICKADGIKAIYQYVTFSQELEVKGFELSVTATADQLEPQAIGASYGALALIKLNDGSFDSIQLQFPSNIEPLNVQSSIFSTEKSSISSVTIMLMCYGYTGSIHFTDTLLIPQVATRKSFVSASKFIEKCPAALKKENKLAFGKVEEIVKADDKSIKSHRHLITLVTQVSMDRLAILERSLQLWNGPVSLVIYITAKNDEISENDWQRLYIQKKLKNMKLPSSSHVTLVFGSSKKESYPINYLRNIAIKQVHSEYMFLLDGDFQPSPDFQHKFANHLKHSRLQFKTAYVVPAFEYIELPQRNDNSPQTKEELLQLLHREEPFIVPFRIYESSDSHKITDYWKWYRADKMYSLSEFSDKYEPYVILKKTSSLPYYDERFTGYGMNKVTHITELHIANYTFTVLPDMWVLHLPHKISSYAIDFLQNPHHRLENRMERFEFIADIMHKYKFGSCQLH